MRPGIGGGNRMPAATMIVAQPMVGRMMMVQHCLYGARTLSRSWARCPFGQTANWTQMIWCANTYLGVRPCTFLGAICYKFLSGV